MLSIVFLPPFLLLLLFLSKASNIHAFYGYNRAFKTDSVRHTCFMRTESVRKITIEAYGDSHRMFLRGLEDRITSPSHIDEQESKEIQYLLRIHIKALNYSSFATLLNSTVSLCEHSPTTFVLTDRSRDLMLNASKGILYSLENRDDLCALLGILRNLAGIDFSWYNMRRVVGNNELENDIAAAMPYFDDTLLIKLLTILSRTGAYYSRLSRRFRMSLFHCFVSKTNSLSKESFLACLEHLNIMGFLPHYAKHSVAIVNKVSKLALSLSPSQSSAALIYMAELNVSYNTLTIQTVENLLKRVCDIPKMSISAHDVERFSQSLSALCKLGLDWSKCSESLQQILQVMVFLILKSDHITSIEQCVSALATLKFPESELTKLKYRIISAAGKILTNNPEPRLLIRTMTLLVESGFHWHALSNEIQESIISNVIDLRRKSLYPSQVADLLKCLESLDMSLGTLTPSFLNALFRIIDSQIDGMNAYDFNRVIFVLSRCDVTWDMLLPNSTISGISMALVRLKDEFTLQSIASLAYGLVLMCFDSEPSKQAMNPPLHKSLKTLLNILQSRGKMREIKNAIEGIVESAPTHNSNARLGKEGLKQISLINKHYINMGELQNANSQSLLQKRVIEQLYHHSLDLLTTPYEYEVVAEYSSFSGVFPVDAAVLKKGEVVALVEVDGPHHFRYDKKRRRKDNLKEYMYRNKHPEAIFHRINYLDEKQMGTYILSREFVVALQTSQEEKRKLRLSRLVTRIMSEVKEFFDWTVWNELADLGYT